ncbi:MAG: hypothetical protein IJU77_10330 [Butyrivibrio sp.]|nr:hypothetical protein [Butyrivibrio sp.]
MEQLVKNSKITGEQKDELLSVIKKVKQRDIPADDYKKIKLIKVRA